MEQLKKYQTPEVESIKVEIEKGFAGSQPGGEGGGGTEPSPWD